MGRFIDLTGQRFGRLVAIRRAERVKPGPAYWLCRCDCGNECHIISQHLRRGATRSCGCLRPNMAHGKSGTPLYRAWQGMRQRCGNSFKQFKDYGGRGITVCPEWQNSLITFRDWALSHPDYAPGLTIERINNNGNYEPLNCTWIPAARQQRNTRRNRAVIRSDGARFASIAEAAEQTPGSRYNNICDVCRGHRKTSAGYGWRYAAKEPPTQPHPEGPAMSVGK